MFKQEKLEKSILKKLEKYPKAKSIFKKMIKDKELNDLLELANLVSITRLNFNDHGKTHVLIVIDSGLKLLKLLNYETNLKKEKQGTLEDSIIAIIMGAYMHDLGMCLNRNNHELFGIILAKPIMERILKNHKNKHKIIATAMEGILCHMANYKPTSIEAGLISVADGTDMTAGRARIAHTFERRKGKIHTYSAMSVLNVKIKKGEKKPILIEILMRNPAGIFQIEEIMLPKISNSGLSNKIEVKAIIKDTKEELKIL